MTQEELKEYMKSYRQRLDVKLRTAELQRERYRKDEGYRKKRQDAARERYRLLKARQQSN